MNPAHLHIVVNQVPVVAYGLALVLAITGLVKRSDGVIGSALLVGVIASIGAFIAHQSGIQAAPLVAELDGTSLPSIEEHRQRAQATVALAGFAAALSLGALAALARGSLPLRRALITGATAFYLLLCVAVGWTAGAGNRIRHAEISMDWSEQPADDSR